MQLQLPEKFVKKLLEQSESGMGYQNVTVLFVDGSFLDTTVQNADRLDLPDDIKYIKEIERITVR